MYFIRAWKPGLELSVNGSPSIINASATFMSSSAWKSSGIGWPRQIHGLADECPHDESSPVSRSVVAVDVDSSELLEPLVGENFIRTTWGAFWHFAKWGMRCLPSCADLRTLLQYLQHAGLWRDFDFLSRLKCSQASCRGRPGAVFFDLLLDFLLLLLCFARSELPRAMPTARRPPRDDYHHRETITPTTRRSPPPRARTPRWFPFEREILISQVN